MRKQKGGTLHRFPLRDRQKSTRHYREELLKKRNEFLSVLGLHSQKLATAERASEDDLTTHLQDQSVQLGLNQVVHTQLREVEFALARLAAGEYGTCADCGEPIASTRLNAVPWARYCINCQEKLAA